MLTWKRVGRLTALMLGIALLLNGCLDCETESVVIDVVNKTGKMIYGGLSSSGETADQIEEDFQGLVNTVNDKTENAIHFRWEENPNKPIKILSKELYSSNNKLYGRVLVQLKNEVFPKNLEEFGLKLDDQGNYILNLGEDEAYTGGNGQFIQEGSTRIVKWPRKTEKIEFERSHSHAKDEKMTNLLPRWIEWKKEQSQSE